MEPNQTTILNRNYIFSMTQKREEKRRLVEKSILGSIDIDIVVFAVLHSVNYVLCLLLKQFINQTSISLNGKSREITLAVTLKKEQKEKKQKREKKKNDVYVIFEKRKERR